MLNRPDAPGDGDVVNDTNLAGSSNPGHRGKAFLDFDAKEDPHRVLGSASEDSFVDSAFVLN